jgi:hypothetical protein
VKAPPHFDVAEHLRIWRRHVLPLFTAVGALLMIVFVVVRTGSSGAPLPGEGFVAAPVGLIPADADFDPAFAILSPTEMALSPQATVFDPPLAPFAGAEDGKPLVRAAADGLVVFAGPHEGSHAVLLSHRTAEGLVQTFYGGLEAPRVAPGRSVRRGQALGTLAGEDAPEGLRFERRRFPALALEGVSATDEAPPEGRQGRPADRLSPAPEALPVEPEALLLDSEAAPRGR